MAVTKTNNLRYGMKNNEDIKQLQTLLNQNGANLTVDGSFGSKTLAAVKEYQKNNNLKVDGIVGTNTWGALTSGASANKQTTTQTPAPAELEKSYRYDAENDPVYQQAVQAQQQVQSQAPTYAGTYDQQVKDMYEQVMNQKPFEYDLNGDALWQQYKDQYTTQGKLAMMDTMGQAAALTGGYGSSYSQAAGQQAYQGHLQQLNDRVPELYQLALSKYNNDQAILKDKFGVAAQMQADEYGKYQDAMSQHNVELDRAQSAADTAYDRGYNAWATEEQLRRQDEETSYGRQQSEYDKLANLIASTGYSPSKSELTAAGMSNTQAAAYAKVYSDSKKAVRSTGSRKSGNLTIPSEIKSAIGKYKTAGEKSAYISQLEQNGVISSELADYMRSVYDAYEIDVESEYRKLMAAGAQQRELDQYLKEQIQEGQITLLAATELRDRRW